MIPVRLGCRRDFCIFINLPVLHQRDGNEWWLAEDLLGGHGEKRVFATSSRGVKAKLTNCGSKWQWLQAVPVSSLSRTCLGWRGPPCNFSLERLSDLGLPHVLQFWLCVVLHALSFLIFSLVWFICRRGEKPTIYRFQLIFLFAVSHVSEMFKLPGF